MASKQLQPAPHLDPPNIPCLINRNSEDLDILNPVRQANREQLSHILSKVEELKVHLEHKQVNDPRFIKMVPVVDLGSDVVVEDPMPKQVEKQGEVVRVKPKENTILRPKDRRERMLNFLVSTADSKETASEVISNLVPSKHKQQILQNKIQRLPLVCAPPLSQRSSPFRLSLLNNPKKINSSSKPPLSQRVNRSSSYNMIHLRHIQHKYTHNPNGTVRNYLKKGAGITGAIMDRLASDQQRRRINYNKNVYYEQHNQALPEDAAVWWDKKVFDYLGIMKGAKEKKMEKEGEKSGETYEQYEYEEVNLDEELGG